MKKARTNTIKRIETALLLIGMLLLPAAMSHPARAASSAGDVILEDLADLLSQEEKNDLLSRGRSLAAKTGWDVYMVTTDDTSGREARDYAEDYYMAHYRQDDGFVSLIDMDNREIYLATSGEVIYYVTDDRRDEILDKAFDAISRGDYSGCIRAMLDGVDRARSAGVDSSHYTYNEDTGKVEYYTPPKAVTLPEACAAGLLGLISALGMNGIISSSYKKKGKKYQYNAVANTSLQLAGKSDRLVNRFTTSRRIPKNPPPSSRGGGSSSGRSTTHSGSGGHSFGGGGRKF